MFTVEVEKGVKVYAADINPGYGKTVFFIHGWPLNHKMFEYQLDALPESGFRCFALDLRGFGASDAPWSGYTYDRLADDVYAVIRSLNIKQTALVGFSMGGAVAVRYMARYRGYKISRLALLAAAAPSFVERQGYPYGMTSADVDALILQTYRDRPAMLREFGKNFFARPVSEAFSYWFESLGLSASGHATIRCAESLRDEDLRYDLPRIRVPTGIFHGALDRICPFAFAEELRHGIADASLFRYEQSGHAVFYDELEQFNHDFVQFLDV